MKTASYAEFRQQEYKPLLDKVFAAVYPILSAHEQTSKLSEVLKNEFVFTLADRLTSEFFAKSLDFVKKQNRLNEAEAEQKQRDDKMAKIKAMRAISFEDFRVRIIANMDALVKERNPGKMLAIDEYCKNALNLCLEYFHPTTQAKMNRNKGVCLLGPVGTGKSTLLTAFCDNPFASFRIVKAQDIVDSYIDSPEQTINKILSETPMTDKENAYGFTRYDLLIEEVGREQLSVQVKKESWKTTPVNVIERVLMELYDSLGVRVHMISNAETPGKLAALYGEAAASRVYDMFNVITLDPKAPNRRFL